MPYAYFFHRLSPAPYFVSLTAGEYDLLPHYNYINDPEHNGGTGQAAAADDVKLYGPNQGSYYVAFGEDAIGLYANRPAQALALNTDFLDNLMHQDLALPTVYVVTATGTNQITVPEPISGAGGVFLGGTPTSPADDFTDLFHLCDVEDEDLTLVYLPTGAPLPIVVIAAHDNGTPSSASPYFSGGSVTLTFNASIPTGTVVRIYYGMRSNLASLPPDALTYTNIRTLTNLSYQTEEIFAELQGPEVLGIPWDGPGGMASPGFLSTIWDLSMSGLNERYNRSTTADATSPPVIDPPEDYWPTTGVDYGPLNTAGAGGWIKRTGPALTVYSGNTHQDPLGALFSAKSWDTSASGGVVGFAAYGSRLSGINTAESSTGRIPGTALFAGLWPHDTETGLPSANFLTRIPAGTGALLACSGSNNPAIVTLSVGFFYNTSNESAIAVGYDLLEVTYASGKVETFVIVGLSAGNNQVAMLRYPDGTVPTSASGQDVTVRWVSTSFAVGDGAGPYHSTKYSDTSPVLLDGLYYQVPPVLTSIPSSYDTVPRLPAMFSAQDTDYDSPALMWGGFNNLAPTSGPDLPSMLTGDGGMSVGAPSFFWGTVNIHALSFFWDTVNITAGSASSYSAIINAGPLTQVTLEVLPCAGAVSDAALFRGGAAAAGLLEVPGGYGARSHGGAGYLSGRDGIGFFGYGGGATNGIGTAGLASGTGIGVLGGAGGTESALLAAAYAFGLAGVAGFADGGPGVYGQSLTGVGVLGKAVGTISAGVWGEGGFTSTLAGVGGYFTGGTPSGTGSGGTGVHGVGGSTAGGLFDGVGVLGESAGVTNGIGVVGLGAASTYGIGLVGAASGWALDGGGSNSLLSWISNQRTVGVLGIGAYGTNGIGIVGYATGTYPAILGYGTASYTPSSSPANDGIGLMGLGGGPHGSGVQGTGQGQGAGVQGIGSGATLTTLDVDGHGAGGYFLAGTTGPGAYCKGSATEYGLSVVDGGVGAIWANNGTSLFHALTCSTIGATSPATGLITFTNDVTITSGQLVLGSSGLSCSAGTLSASTITAGTLSASTITAGDGGLSTTGTGNIYSNTSIGANTYISASDYLSTSGYVQAAFLSGQPATTGTVLNALFQNNISTVVGRVESDNVNSTYGIGFSTGGWNNTTGQFTIITEHEYDPATAIVMATAYLVIVAGAVTSYAPVAACGVFTGNTELVIQVANWTLPDTSNVVVNFTVYGAQS
jgi:hypothetical protein